MSPSGLLQPRWNSHPKYAQQEVDAFGRVTGTDFHSGAVGVADNARHAIRANAARAAAGGHSAAALEEQRRLAAADNGNVALLRGSVDALFTRKEEGDDFCYHWRTETKHDHTLRMSRAGSRHLLGKARQACFRLDEQLPYRHTDRASDPMGWDRRSRLENEYRKHHFRDPFSLVFPRAQEPSKTSALGNNPGVNFVQLANEGSIAYDRVAVHPSYSKYRKAAF